MLGRRDTEQLPLETCETMNNSWGFSIKDDNYKSVPKLIHYIVNAAGRNANFLLNVGPQLNGIIQQEFQDTLKEVGKWMDKYGESIYGTRGSIMPAKDWGVVTSKDNEVYVHLLNDPKQESIVIDGIKGKVKSCELMGSGEKVKCTQNKGGVTIDLSGISFDNIDTIIEIKTK